MSAQKPYRLITTDDPTKTLGEGEMRYFATILDAANAYVKAPASHKVIVYDDGHHEARELNDPEQFMLERVCEMFGFEIIEAA